MNNPAMYDQFSEDYDRFVNWEGRLTLELPFLSSELNKPKGVNGQPVRILDVACGTGQHVIALAKLGFDCSGADFSKNMITVAKNNAQKAKVKIPFSQAGFGELSTAFRQQKYDSLICLGNSLPHVLDEASMLETLVDFKSVLIPGGKIIIQIRNFDSVIKSKQRWMPPEKHREGDNTWTFVRFYDFDPDGLLTFNIIILTEFQGGEFQQHVISTRLWPFTQLQLSRWLEISGFQQIRLFGSLQGEPFNAVSSPNLVITATV